MGIAESTLFSIGGQFIFLVSSLYLLCCYSSLCLINGAHSQSQLAETLILAAHYRFTSENTQQHKVPSSLGCENL